MARMVFVLAITAILLAGCSGRATSEETRSMWLVDDPELQDDWFCEPAKDGGWDCVQDPQRVANPRPARLPEPLFARERAFPAARIRPGARFHHPLPPASRGPRHRVDVHRRPTMTPYPSISGLPSNPNDPWPWSTCPATTMRSS